MITLPELLAELDARGVKLQIVEEKLRYHPAEAMPSELITALREHKAEIIRKAADEARHQDSAKVSITAVAKVDDIENLMEAINRRWGPGTLQTGSRYAGALQLSAMLNIACADPVKHRRAWKSSFGDHLHCGDCYPPVSEEVISEWIDLDSEWRNVLQTPKRLNGKNSGKGI